MHTYIHTTNSEGFLKNSVIKSKATLHTYMYVLHVCINTYIHVHTYIDTRTYIRTYIHMNQPRAAAPQWTTARLASRRIRRTNLRT